MSSDDRWRLGHRPALDGVRGLAILLVLADHVRLPGLTAAGPAGVTVFFCLSGFLITALLLEERSTTGRISLAGFYRRRALRLLPALIVFLVVMTVVTLLLGFPTRSTLFQALPVLLYVGNWVTALGGHLVSLSITWSLAVEEQFYLVWPLVLIMFARFGRSPLLVVTAVGSVYAVTAKLLLWDGGAGWQRVYYGSDTQALGLLLGCALAIWLHHSDSRPRITRRLTVGLLTALAACALIPTEFGRLVLVPAVVPLITAAVLYALATSDVPAWLTWPPLRLVGRRSYGLYLWHTLPILVVLPGLREAIPDTVAVLLMVAAAWGITALSWRYVERPFLAMRHRAPVNGSVALERGGQRIPAG